MAESLRRYIHGWKQAVRSSVMLRLTMRVWHKLVYFLERKTFLHKLLQRGSFYKPSKFTSVNDFKINKSLSVQVEAKSQGCFVWCVCACYSVIGFTFKTIWQSHNSIKNKFLFGWKRRKRWEATQFGKSDWRIGENAPEFPPCNVRKDGSEFFGRHWMLGYTMAPPVSQIMSSTVEFNVLGCIVKSAAQLNKPPTWHQWMFGLVESHSPADTLFNFNCWFCVLAFFFLLRFVSKQRHLNKG